MKPIYRTGKLEDFDPLFGYPSASDDQEHRRTLYWEWAVLLNNPTTMTMFVEDGDCPSGPFVACGQAVFVTEKFAEFASKGLPPWINNQLTRPLPDASNPLLDYEGVARANATTGLIAAVTRWDVHRRFAPEVALKLRRDMQRWFEAFSSGYNYKEIWAETTGPDAKEEAIRAGLRVIDDYANCSYDLPEEPGSRPCLLRITREEATTLPGALMTNLFAFTPPRAFFARGEQDVLNLTLGNYKEEAIAVRLNLSVHTIHLRWKKIYERFDDNIFTLPKGAAGKRGPEKQRIVLDYVRDHPEELRPYAAPRSRRQKQHA